MFNNINSNYLWWFPPSKVDLFCASRCAFDTRHIFHVFSFFSPGDKKVEERKWWMWNLVNCLLMVLNLLPGSLFVFDFFLLRPLRLSAISWSANLGINFSNLMFEFKPQERQMFSDAECPPGLTFLLWRSEVNFDAIIWKEDSMNMKKCRHDLCSLRFRLARNSHRSQKSLRRAIIMCHFPKLKTSSSDLWVAIGENDANEIGFLSSGRRYGSRIKMALNRFAD